MTQHFDLVVLGAGPGGYVAAIRAAQLGLSVAVVEKQYWGGVCLNLGCVPAKTLLRNAEIAHIVNNERDAYGIDGDVTMHYGAAHARSRKVAAGRVKGVQYLMRKNGVQTFDAQGTFVDSHRMELSYADGTRDSVSFDRAVIATGATARIPTGLVLGERVVAYDTLILTQEAPESMVIVGAGAIGVEFAYLFRAYGTEVTIVESLDRVLPVEDQDVSAEMRRQLEKLGIEVMTSASVQDIHATDDDVTVRVETSNADTREVTVEKVLIATGFAPRTEGFGLENTGVSIDERGAIVIDEYMRTSVPDVYAIGDVTAKLSLAHVAEAQGVVAATHAAGKATEPLRDYRMMPRATFSQPQVASFGLTEVEAESRGREITVSTFPFAANAKAHALGDSSGFVKLIADAKYGELLGAHMIGHDVSELLPELTLAQKFELTAEDLSLNTHTHPTMSEALQEAFHGLVGPMLNL